MLRQLSEDARIAPLTRAPRPEADLSDRRAILDLLSHAPQSASGVARALHIPRGEIEDELRHVMRSAEAAGYRVEIAPAQCKACGFTFDRSRLSKPSKCPACRESRIVEAMIRVVEGKNG